MSFRHVIMAAGEGSRWMVDGKPYEGVPKHLCDPEQCGEPLIARLCRQLAEQGETDVVLTGPKGYARHVPAHVRIATPRRLADTDQWLGATKFANTIPHWSPTDRTILWFGDCWLDDAVVDRIIGHGRPNRDRHLWLNWCRLGANPHTGCRYGENFAVSFWPEHHETYLEAMRITAQTHREGVINRSGGWEIARAMAGARGTRIRRPHRLFECMRDVGHLGSGFSDDMDRPDDLDRWRENRAKYLARNRAQCSQPRSSRT